VCLLCAKAPSQSTGYMSPRDVSEMQVSEESCYSAAESMGGGHCLLSSPWCFTGSQKIQESQLRAAFLPEKRLEFFHFSVSLKPGPEQRWIHQETAFPLQISTTISCYYNKPLHSAAPLHRLFYKQRYCFCPEELTTYMRQTK